MQQDLFGNTHKEYVKVVRKGKSNTRVELPDGSQVLVPTADLAFWKFVGVAKPEKTNVDSHVQRKIRYGSGQPDHPFDRLDFNGSHDYVVTSDGYVSPF